MKKAVKADTFLEFQYVSNPRLSPDGETAVYVVQQADASENKYHSDLWVTGADGGSRRLTSTGDAKMICWTPEGTVLFASLQDEADKKASEKGEEFTVFYEINPKGGDAAKAFTLPHRVINLGHLEGELYYFTSYYDRNRPDLENLEGEAREKALQEYKNPPYRVFDEVPFWFNGLGIINGKRLRLYVYNRVSGEITAVTGPCFELAHVSHRGSRLIYTGQEYTSVRQQGWNNGLYTYDAAQRQYETLLAPGTMDLRFGEFWGDDVLMYAGEQKKYSWNETPYFFLLDGKSHALTLLKDYLLTIGHPANSDSRLGSGQTQKMVGDTFYFLSLDNYTMVLRSLDRQGNVKDVIVPENGTIDAFDICNGRVVYTSLQGNSPAELCENGRQLTHFNDFFERDYEVVTPQHHTFVDRDGFTIDGWAMLPAGYEAGRKYPALLEIHGGPRTASGMALYHEMQMFVNAGYFVFFCNPRGSDGKGDAFADIWGRYGTVDYDNLMQFMDIMLKKYPDVDPARTGVLGGSYGGFMTNWIIGHTNRFAAAASQRSISNWITQEHTSDIGSRLINQIRATTATNFEKVWAASPLKYAHHCTTPTIFIHSDEDYRCWQAEGLSMFSALKYQGVDTKLCLFRNENHELSRSGRPLNRISRLEEMLSWFEKYLR